MATSTSASGLPSFPGGFLGPGMGKDTSPVVRLCVLLQSVLSAGDWMCKEGEQTYTSTSEPDTMPGLTHAFLTHGSQLSVRLVLHCLLHKWARVVPAGLAALRAQPCHQPENGQRMDFLHPEACHCIGA